MECNEWNEKGLLFAYGELTGSEAAEYKSHTLSCSICKGELEQLQYDRTQLFTTVRLEDTPSRAIDFEIMRVCANRTKTNTPLIIPTVLYKHAMVGFLMLVVGFGGGVYFASFKSANSINSYMNAENKNILSNSAATIATNQTTGQNASNDSITKTNDSTNRINNMGDLEMQGVVPVDLKH